MSERTPAPDGTPATRRVAPAAVAGPARGACATLGHPLPRAVAAAPHPGVLP
jgi:hypothetical protein